jgi:hypothetical protein
MLLKPVLLIGIGLYRSTDYFHVNPGTTQGITHVGKSGKFCWLLFTAVLASLHCFIFLVSFIGVTIFNILDSSLKFSGKKYSLLYIWLTWIRIPGPAEFGSRSRSGPAEMKPIRPDPQHWFNPVLWIHEIFVRIRIRICGFIPLTNGSGSCYFCQWSSRRQIFAYYFLKVHLHHFSNIKSQQKITKQ